MVDQDSENEISTAYDEGIDVEDTRGNKQNGSVVQIKTYMYNLNKANKFLLKQLIPLLSLISNILDTTISMPVAESELDAADTGVVDSSSIIIIHPGSRYLRIGRASDTTPKRILHAVARKRRKPAIKVVFMS